MTPVEAERVAEACPEALAAALLRASDRIGQPPGGLSIRETMRAEAERGRGRRFSTDEEIAREFAASVLDDADSRRHFLSWAEAYAFAELEGAVEFALAVEAASFELKGV